MAKKEQIPGTQKLLMINELLELCAVGGDTQAEMQAKLIEQEKKRGTTYWQMKERSFRNYVAEAKKKLLDKTELHMELLVKRAIRRYDYIFRNAYNGGDYKTALKAQKDLTEILHLDKIHENQIKPEGITINIQYLESDDGNQHPTE